LKALHYGKRDSADRRWFGKTKLFDADPEVYVDTKTAVGMINAQFGAITSPADMSAMRISGIGPGFVTLRLYVRYKVSTLQTYYRAMLVEYSSTAQCKLMQEQRAPVTDAQEF
jgi:hypothetical protein